MRNKWYVLSLVLLVAALLALPGVARSAMWVGAELGGSCDMDTDVTIHINDVKTVAKAVAYTNPAVIGGINIGYMFVNAGFGGRAWPDWMKYFFVATDFTFDRWVVRHQNVQYSPPIPTRMFPPTGVMGGRVEGSLASWFFGVGAHYGFFPDSEIPIGRVHPYVAVGPAILFSGMTVKGLGTNACVGPALGAEFGIRWILLPNVTIDTAYRYRTSHPQYSYPNTQFGAVNVSFRGYLHAFLVRANYHF
jgi:hypothetical protein